MTTLDALAAELQARHPQVAPALTSVAAAFGARGPVTDAEVPLIRKLVLMSRAVVLRPGELVAVASTRGELEPVVTLLHRLALAAPAVAQTVHDAYPRLAFGLTSVGPSLAALAEASLPVAVARAVLARGLAQPTAGQLNRTVEAWLAVARASPGTVTELLAVDDSLATRAHLRGAWLERGTDLVTSGRTEEGLAFLRLQSPESRRLLGLHHAVLSELRTVLGFYATSLAGHALTVLPWDVSGYRAARPHSNGKVLYLPPTLARSPQLAVNQSLYTTLAAEVTGSLVFGTFGFDLAASGLRAPLQERYGVNGPSLMASLKEEYGPRGALLRQSRTGDLEAVFPGGRTLLLLETSLERFVYSFPAPWLAQRLFSLVETARIDARLAARYPGLAEDATRLRPPVRGTARTPFERLWSSVLAEALSWSPGTGRLKPVRRPEATVVDSARLTMDLMADFFSTTEASRLPVGSRGEREWERLLIPAYFAEILGQDSPEQLTETDQRARRTSGGPRDGQIDLTRSRNRGPAGESMVQAIQEGRAKVYQYPEFRVNLGTYEPRYCTLFDLPAPDGPPGFCEATLAKHASTAKKLKKHLAQLVPDGVELRRKCLMGDEVHPDDALDYSTSLLRGATPDDKIYAQKVRQVRDVAVAVLVDSSSSTDAEVDGAKIIDIEKESLVLLATTLEALGDEFALYSFCSLGKDRTLFRTMKAFGEPWGAAVKARVGGFTAVAANRDGCAIRHATTKLLDTDHATKILLLLSDGIPADLDYGASAGETGQQALEDTRRAVLEARQRGVLPYCLTIDREAKGYIAHLYGQFGYSILTDPGRLPEKLSKLYLRMTR